MALKKTIQLTNKSEDALYIDEDAVVAAKSRIKSDLKNIIQVLNNIEKHYKVLRDHKDTKGDWKTLATSCVKKSNTYETKMKNDRASLEDAIDNAIQTYVLTQIKELRKAQQAADNI